MVQTVCTIVIPPGGKKIIFEKPYALSRRFFSVRVMAASAEWFETQISFDDPLFTAYHMINGPEKYFEASGTDIFQGNIWAHNASDHTLTYALTEILH